MRNLIGKLKGLLKKGLYFGGGLITGAMCYNLAFIVGNENHLFGEICQKLGITGHTLAIIGLWLFVFALLIITGFATVAFFVLFFNSDSDKSELMKSMEVLTESKNDTKLVKYAWNGTFESYKKVLDEFISDLSEFVSNVADDEMRNNVLAILNSMYVIQTNVDSKDYKSGNLYRLVEHYIPNTYNLLQSYCALNTMLETDEVVNTRKMLRKTVATCVEIYENIAKEASANELLNMQVDSKTMVQQATLNGLVNMNSPFQLNK